MNLKVRSFQVADSINIKESLTFYTSFVKFKDKEGVFYELSQHKYLYVFKYGVISFLGFTESEMSDILRDIEPHCIHLYSQPIHDEFEIETGANALHFGYNKIEIPGIEAEMIRLIMLNASQSVALDHYNDQTTSLLEETNFHTQVLEKKGKIGLGGIRLKKYIGRTLNLKNKIAANLYIFDSPEETWEDENLNKLDIGLKKTFDLQLRVRNIQEGLAIVKENLDLFKDLLQHRNSSALEWIIIALILVEVLNMVIERVLS